MVIVKKNIVLLLKMVGKAVEVVRESCDPDTVWVHLSAEEAGFLRARCLL